MNCRIFIARLCLVLLFPFSALNKIFDYQAAMVQAAHGWVPLPPTVAALLLALGGMLEVLGQFTWCSTSIDGRLPCCSYSM